jgi:uncharacterized membrane protein
MSTHDVGVWGALLLSACMLWFLLIMTVTAVALIQLLRQSSKPPPWHATHGPAAPHPQHPEHIMAERFARGEIDANTYKAGVDLLRSD